jgi:hypothetical protein
LILKGGIKLKIDKTKYELAKARACKSTKDLVAAGVPAGTLSRATRVDLRPETVGKIARALGVDVTEIIETN